jgi:hypothetical protein
MPAFYAMPFLTPLESTGNSTATSLETRAVVTMAEPHHFVAINAPAYSAEADIDPLRSIGMSCQDSAPEDIGGAPLIARRDSWLSVDHDSTETNDCPAQSMMKQEAKPSNDGRIDRELEPRPLPPVTTVQGETTVYSYSPVPVAQHPGFLQIGPQEYSFSAKVQATLESPRASPVDRN